MKIWKDHTNGCKHIMHPVINMVAQFFCKNCQLLYLMLCKNLLALVKITLVHACTEPKETDSSAWEVIKKFTDKETASL